MYQFITAGTEEISLFLASFYQVSVGVQVLLWIFVIYLTKENRSLFDQLQIEYLSPKNLRVL